MKLFSKPCFILLWWIIQPCIFFIFIINLSHYFKSMSSLNLQVKMTNRLFASSRSSISIFECNILRSNQQLINLIKIFFHKLLLLDVHQNMGKKYVATSLSSQLYKLKLFKVGWILIGDHCSSGGKNDGAGTKQP